MPATGSHGAYVGPWGSVVSALNTIEAGHSMIKKSERTYVGIVRRLTGVLVVFSAVLLGLTASLVYVQQNPNVDAALFYSVFGGLGICAVILMAFQFVLIYQLRALKKRPEPPGK